jgi:hypothetical protein
LGMGKELAVVHFFNPSISWTDFLNKDLWSWKSSELFRTLGNETISYITDFWRRLKHDQDCKGVVSQGGSKEMKFRDLVIMIT